MYLASLHLDQVNCKIYPKNPRFVSKKMTEQFNFFNWLLNLKTLVLSNGSKNARNMIPIALKYIFFSKNF